MAHGYLGDGFGTHGEIEPGSDDHRDHDHRDHDRHRGQRERGWRSEQDWRDRDQGDRSARDERSWRDRDRDQDRGMMFGNRGGWQWEEDRWNDGRWSGEDFIARYSGPGSQRRGSYSANPDDHYRSWRDRHMSELDRDYEDYCREREQQFHNEFDSWRRQKYSNPQPLRTGMTQSGLSHDPTGETQAAEDMAPGTENSPTPTEAATLGTNSGRSRNRG